MLKVGSTVEVRFQRYDFRGERQWQARDDQGRKFVLDRESFHLPDRAGELWKCRVTHIGERVNFVIPVEKVGEKVTLNLQPIGDDQGGSFMGHLVTAAPGETSTLYILDRHAPSVLAGWWEVEIVENCGRDKNGFIIITIFPIRETQPRRAPRLANVA